MEYSLFCGDKISLLGFGCMRFPTINEHIDTDQSLKILKEAYDNGVNYFDTAYPYHNGESELLVGQFLSTLDRKKVHVATKLPVWMVNNLEDAKRLFNEQLSHLQTDYVDFYLLHALDKARFESMRDLKVIDYLVEEQQKGRIRHLGFSFHDSYDSFKEIMSYRKWDFCQIQYNYMDTDYQAGDKGLALASELNVSVIVMEPVKGGSLANFSEEIKKPFTAVNSNRSAASWALLFAADNEQIKLVLSGMSSEEQLKDNLTTFNNYHHLSVAEKQAITSVRNILRTKIRNGCTGCQYCMPCPLGVDIPRNFRTWNEFGMFNNVGAACWDIGEMKKSEVFADKCKKCGACESKCPQKLPIRDDLARLYAEMNQLHS